MAKIQIKSETRHELSFFPNSFDDYVPKDSKVRIFMRLKEDAMNNGQTKPAYNLQIATENQYWTNFALYHNPTDSLTFKPFLDKYRKRHGKQSKCVTADSGYGSEENYEYMEMEEMVGYVKYNWFHKEQHKPFKKDAFNQANFHYNKDEDYYVCPMGQHMNPCGQRQTKSDSSYASVISLYRAQRCEGCPLGGLCKKAKGNRTIYVNHKLNAYKKEAFLLLTPGGRYEAQESETDRARSCVWTDEGRHALQAIQAFRKGQGLHGHRVVRYRIQFEETFRDKTIKLNLGSFTTWDNYVLL